MAIGQFPSNPSNFYSFVIPASDTPDSSSGISRNFTLSATFPPGTYRFGNQQLINSGGNDQNLPDAIVWGTGALDYANLVFSSGVYATFYLASTATSLTASYNFSGWYKSAVAINGGGPSELTYVDGKFFYPTNLRLYSSTDGITWATATAPWGGGQFAFRFGSGETDKYLVFQYSVQTGTYYTSTDGTTWSSRSFPVLANFYDVQHYAGDYYAVVQNTDATASIYQSTNGITWSARYTSSGAGTAINQILNGTGETNPFVAIGGNLDSVRLVVSTNGITWTTSSAFAGLALLGGIYEGGSYYVYPQSQTYYGVSTDGVTWTTASHGGSTTNRQNFAKLTTNEYIYASGSNVYFTTSLTSFATSDATRINCGMNITAGYHKKVTFFNNGTDKYWTLNSGEGSTLISKSNLIYGYGSRIESSPIIIEKLTSRTVIG